MHTKPIMEEPLDSYFQPQRGRVFKLLKDAKAQFSKISKFLNKLRYRKIKSSSLKKTHLQKLELPKVKVLQL